MIKDENEQEIWDKIKTYVRANPQILYKGLPLGILAYISLPYIVLFYHWIPWIWAGYDIYHKLPGGSALILWNAIQKYIR